MSSKPHADTIVIGAGLAGACTAYALARRGARVQIIEAAPGIAEKASGNRVGLLTPYISTRPSPVETLYSQGFCFSTQWLLHSDQLHDLFHRCGALQLPSTDRLGKALSEEAPITGPIKITATDATHSSEISGIQINSQAYHIPEAGFVSPRELITRILATYPSIISVAPCRRAVSLTRDGESWKVLCQDGSHVSAPTIVICAAYEASQLSPCAWLPLEPIRGQTVLISPTTASLPLRCVLAFGGYLTPAIDGLHFLGAHYRHSDTNEEPSAHDTDDIIERCNSWLPTVKFSPTHTTYPRVCFRTSTIDRLPYIGALPDFYSMRHEASQYQPGTDLEKRIPIRMMEGVYVHLGHGSRGLLSCPLGGEIIARRVFGEELKEFDKAASAVDPARLPYRLIG
jgi:tRNA 5-methylaminomethyl-2-thiouridine biosynthesis bifunctional protein